MSKLKDYAYRIRVNSQDLADAKEYCENNFSPLQNEIRKLINKFAKLNRKENKK